MLPTPSTSLPADNCALEEIRIPGAIQPHGFLLTLTACGRVAQVSANIADWCGMNPEELLGGALSAALGNEATARINLNLANLKEGETLVLGTVGRLKAGGSAAAAGDDQSWAVIVHLLSGVRIVELERTRQDGDVFALMYPLVRSFLTGVQTVQTLPLMTDLAAREISHITGFGRTLVYAFDDKDGHGEVLAEALLPGFDSYMGQRFPGSDIPAQARDLYKRNRIRLIADADYAPQALIPPIHPEKRTPTDLALASLRSVSPVHIQYMKNMRTQASMSMSIVVNGKLWGLISCHHDRPRVPPFEVRAACEHISQLLSMQIGAMEAQNEAADRLLARKNLSSLLNRMAKTEHFLDVLTSDHEDLLKITAAEGAAIVFEGRITLLGSTPGEADVEALIAYLAEQPEDIVATNSARSECPWLDDGTACAGFLSVSLSKIYRNYVIWFRPEVIETIEWAGDPRAKLLTLSGTISPRESFDVWTETVRGRCASWEPHVLEVASEFRTAMLVIVLARAEELANLALELTQANKELEEFSSTVSHDLRAPLRHIHSFAALLNDMEAEKLSDRGKNFIERIIASSEMGGRLVDDLLAFAQMGRAALERRPVDLGRLVKEIVDNEKVDPDVEVIWRVGALPEVAGDVVFLRRAFQNLIPNAIKFSQKRVQAVITIDAHVGTGNMTGFDIISVADNGVGFDMTYANKLFRVFQRLHREEDFDGTGIGLANVRRIVERHGGSVRAEGKLNEGATFFIALPRDAPISRARRQESAAAIVARMAATGALAPTSGVRKKEVSD